MALPLKIQIAEQQADTLLEVLEAAAACGIAQSVMESVVSNGATDETLADARRGIRTYVGRGKVSPPIKPAPVSQLWYECMVLARDLRDRSKTPKLADVDLIAESIFSASVSFQNALFAAKSRKRSRGKPSQLTSPEAVAFIERLTEIWAAYSGRKPRAGDGDTHVLNFNNFVRRAFKCSDVEVNSYTLPRVMRALLVG